MDRAITAHNVTVTVNGTPLLRHLSFTVPAGKITGIIGPSGAGKTTVIRSLLGLQRIHSGELQVLNQPPGAKPLHRHIGYVTQAPSVYADLSVQENLNYFAALLGLDERAVQTALEQVELTRYATRIVSNLSGGQRARVSLAVALLGQPKLLLLDEPTVGLDPLLRQNLWDLFRQLSTQGVTLIISSHAMDEAEKCDTLLFIREGQLLASGTPQHIRHQTKCHDLEAAFIALAYTSGSTP